MELKNDWSLAHFLYYMTLLFRIGIVIFAVISTISFFKFLTDGQIFINQLPVQLEIEKESSAINISNINLAVKEVNQLTAEITLTGSDNNMQGTVIGFYLINILKLALYFSVLFLLGKIFKSIIEEEPFHEKNPKRLYTIGWILILYKFLFLGYNFFFAQPFFEQLNFAQGFTITHLNFYGDSFLYAGFFMVVLGYVFEEGTRLYNEQKLTV